MQAMQDAATPDVDTDADTAEDTNTMEQTAHPRNVYAQNLVIMSLVIVTSQRLIR